MTFYLLQNKRNLQHICTRSLIFVVTLYASLENGSIVPAGCYSNLYLKNSVKPRIQSDQYILGPRLNKQIYVTKCLGLHIFIPEVDRMGNSNVCEALIYLLDNIYIRFGTKLYRQIVGIPMGTNCAPLVADLFLFCYERDFMTSLSDVKQAEIIEAFKSSSRYLDDLLNIDNPYFEGMVNRIYPPELQLNKANTADTEAQIFGFAFIYFKRICFI